jgi:hypothetical protein
MTTTTAAPSRMNGARTTPPAPQQQPLPRASRMTLSSVVKGKQERPYRIVGYGPEGVGKSTFGADAPAPIFLPTEDGTFHLDVARFPKPQSLEDVFDAVAELTNTQHEFRTFVIDTLDHLEPLVWQFICTRDKKANVEEYGYGKGYAAALDEWRRLVVSLERLQNTKGMHVILLAHSQAKTFKNPLGDDYDRYSLKLNDKAGGLLKEWADDVLFMRHEEYAKKDDKKRVRGVSTGARLIYTERSAAFDAKNRHSLPGELPLAWLDFDAACRAHQVADPDVLIAEITRKAQEAAALDEAFAKQILETIPKMGGDPERLAVLNNRVNARIAAIQEQRQSAQKDEVQ